MCQAMNELFFFFLVFRTLDSPLVTKKRRFPTKKTSKGSEFPIIHTTLEKEGFPTVLANTSSYHDYRNSVSHDGLRITRHRGFLVGNPVEFPAIVSTSGMLQYGSYLITGEKGQITAKMVVTVHACDDTAVRTPVSYRQFNPCQYEIVADMVDTTKRPWRTAFHLSLDRMLKVGEYRYTRQEMDGSGSYYTGVLWIDNARLRKSKK